MLYLARAIQCYTLWERFNAIPCESDSNEGGAWSLEGTLLDDAQPSTSTTHDMQDIYSFNQAFDANKSEKKSRRFSILK